MITVEFVGGHLDGHATARTSGHATREVTISGEVYGCVDVYDTGDDMHLLYAHIEDADARPQDGQ